MKKLALGILAAIFGFFIFAPNPSMEFLLTALKYHPWLLCIGIAMLLGLYVWLLRKHYYSEEPEEPTKI